MLAAACTRPTSGRPVAVLDATTGTTPVTTTGERPFPTTEPSYPSSTSYPTTTTSGPPLTIANRKVITTPPACASFVTPADIGRLTGTTAHAEPEDKGFCGYTLDRSGTPAGVALIVLNESLDAQNTEPTTFEGNSAYRLSTVDTTCDLRVALTDDQSVKYRVLWVSLVLSGPSEPVCGTVEKLARHVFGKLPGG
ncbi:hypothetical protein KIPE111705_46665 [Kibdelosporangium persicum]|uniref:DUF3558 domain-containing protein n=2 Tax=Kibdelosporangium persicum TaxID=2698649 RepID=A0ABX2FBA4_9PSEU|nr:hypothetical protein [Kibdelosporangium persicum]